MSAISFSGNTNLGMIRTNNEDAFVVQNIWDEHHVLAVAIDGVGGYEGGEVAAAIAQKCIVEYLEKYSNGERHELLKQAVIYANNTIHEERKLQPQFDRMSCVLTAILVEEEARRINMAHVGDTRLYEYNEGFIHKLSYDHSLVGYREEIGDLTEEEAMAHPQRNIISRDLGSAHWEEDTKEVEVNTFPLQPSSILLLCSDGLCDMITSVQMKEILAENISLEEKVQALIDSANVAGGKDNVTVVLVQTEFPYESSPVHVQLEVTKTPASSVDKPSQTSAKKGEDKKPLTPKKTSRSASSGGKRTSAKSTSVAKKSSAFTLTTLLSILITAIVALGIGYYLGGSTGSNTFPKVFPPVKIVDSAKVDSIVVARTLQMNDSIKMQNDSITTLNDSITRIQTRIDAVKKLVSQSE